MSDEQSIALELDDRETLGRDAAPPGSFNERIFLGRPQVVDLRDEDLSAEQKQVLAQSPAIRFIRTTVPLTLVHEERYPFESVWLQISLNTTPTPGLAIARSMDPSMLFDPIEITRASKLGASLKFVAEHSHQTKATDRAIYLESLYEGGANPTWSFTRTEQQLRGRYLLDMVVEIARTAQLAGVVQLGATLRAYRMGVFSYRARMEPATALLFEAAPEPRGQVGT